jgi:hypothetical protein
MKLEIVPLLSIPFVIYVVLTLVTGRADVPWHEAAITQLPLYSKDVWNVTWGDIFLAGSTGLLFVELVRATKPGNLSIANHLLSFILFVLALLAFILVPGFGNSVFFLFLTMTFLDPMAGLVVTTRAASKDVTLADKAGLLG